MPRVSVVTATYNRSHILRHSIASVIAQRLTDWELIVVGDACTDDTADVVASFDDPRIRYHALAANVGEQSGPNNEGVALARGEMIAFLNHDDLWLPDHLALLVRSLESTPADLVFSLMAVILPGRRPVLGNFTPSGRYEARTVVPASSWLFRRALGERVGAWRSYRECYQAPSQDWLHRAMRAGADMRLVPALTLVTLPSGYRAGSYANRDDSEQAGWSGRIRTDTSFREGLLTEIALGQAGGDVNALSTTAAWPYIWRGSKNAVAAALSAVGVSPAAVRLFLQSPRRGAFIERLRQIRGLPPLSRERTP